MFSKARTSVRDRGKVADLSAFPSFANLITMRVISLMLLPRSILISMTWISMAGCYILAVLKRVYISIRNRPPLTIAVFTESQWSTLQFAPTIRKSRSSTQWNQCDVVLISWELLTAWTSITSSNGRASV